MQLAVSRVHLCNAWGLRGPNLMTRNFIVQESILKRDYTTEFRNSRPGGASPQKGLISPPYHSLTPLHNENVCAKIASRSHC